MTRFSREALQRLYHATYTCEPSQFRVLRADGSNRELYRLVGPDGTSVIGVHGPDAAENRAFVTFSRSLRAALLPVPEILAVDHESHIYLEEDLGGTTLYDALNRLRGEAGEFPEAILPAYRKVVQALPRFQVEGGRHIDYSLCYPRAEFDRRSMMWDLHYFKYMFIKLSGVPFDEERLEDDFERLADFLLEAEIEHFLYRDFQSRNIMLRGDDPLTAEPWFIDYQGGRRGALQYDIASLLYDAKADIPPAIRAELLEYYLDALSELVPVDRPAFLRLYPGFVLIRALQAMGAYGYRGLYEGKAHFTASIPYGIRNIRNLLEEDFPLPLPELADVFEWLARWEDSGESTTTVLPEPIADENIEKKERPLHLHLTSFSYKRGSYPRSRTEHGGGFVFDCRIVHNPGRYDEFRDKTGLDEEVIRFLENREDVEAFWESVRSIVDNAITHHTGRRFDYLSVAFGCTGGQHRSVYFTERMRRYLAERYPQVVVHTQHREQKV